MRLAKSIKIFLCIVVACVVAALADYIPTRPHHSYVYDENRLMSAQQVEYFNQLAEELYRKAGVGLAVALVDDVGISDARAFATETAHKWGIGGKTDEGILIFVALKQRRRSVEVGYGAEGYLPDVLVERLQQQYLIPAFRKEKYGEGVLLLAYSLAQIVAQEKGFTLEVDATNVPGEEPMTPQGWIFIVVVFLLLMSARGRGGLFYFLLGSMLSSNHHRHGGFGGGGFGGGFGGHGGFGGGFGGGRFGGGGSGGSW